MYQSILCWYQRDTGRSYRDRCALTIDGYVRTSTEADDGLMIPLDIQQIILMFYLFDIAIESEMIFDKNSIDTRLCQIIHTHKIKLIKKPTMSCTYFAKLNHGISINPNDYTYSNIKCISWSVKIYGSLFCGHYFVGVVSNSTKVDPLGITGFTGCVYHSSTTCCQVMVNADINTNMYSWQQSGTVNVKYIINDRKLIFTNRSRQPQFRKCEMTIPTNNDEITHWYPCIGLTETNNKCEIFDIVIE